MFGTCDTKRGVQGLRAAVMVSLLLAAVALAVIQLIADTPRATGTSSATSPPAQHSSTLVAPRPARLKSSLSRDP